MKKNQSAQYLTVDSTQSDRRLDNFLQFQLKEIPRTRIYQMIRRGEVRVNGSRAKQNHRILAGDEIRIPPLRIEPSQKAQANPSRSLRALLERAIIHEDEQLLVLNKPSGMVVHSGSNQDFGVIEYLRVIRDDLSFLELVHRLDRDTSGCLLMAKDALSLRQAQNSLRSKNSEKTYLTFLRGKFPKRPLEVNKALKKNTLAGGERMVQVESGGKDAHTIFERERAYSMGALVKARLFTGRTHQIRVHAATVHHPVAMDHKYGDREFNKELKARGLKRMFLHAWRLQMDLPSTAQHYSFEAPLSEELEQFLQNLPS